MKKWVDDIMPLLTDDYPLGVDSFATHVLPLDEAPHAYEIFQKKQDGAVKITLKPQPPHTEKLCPPRCFAQRFDLRAIG